LPNAAFFLFFGLRNYAPHPPFQVGPDASLVFFTSPHCEVVMAQAHSRSLFFYLPATPWPTCQCGQTISFPTRFLFLVWKVGYFRTRPTPLVNLESEFRKTSFRPPPPVQRLRVLPSQDRRTTKSLPHPLLKQLPEPPFFLLSNFLSILESRRTPTIPVPPQLLL